MKDQNLRSRNKLLSDIVDGLRVIQLHGERARLMSIQVTFHVTGTETFKFGLVFALDAIANDLYYDERGNWADADAATVEVI